MAVVALSIMLVFSLVFNATGAWFTSQTEGESGSETFGIVNINNVGTDVQVFQTPEVNLDYYLVPGDEMTIDFSIENTSNVKILLRARLDMSSENYNQGDEEFDEAFDAVNNAFRTELSSVLSDWHYNSDDGYFYLMPGGQLHYDANSDDYYALDGDSINLSGTFNIPSAQGYPEVNWNILQSEIISFSFNVEAVQAANQFVGILNDEPWLAGGWSTILE